MLSRLSAEARTKSCKCGDDDYDDDGGDDATGEAHWNGNDCDDDDEVDWMENIKMLEMKMTFFQGELNLI